jgi:hypothetical protein
LLLLVLLRGLCMAGMFKILSLTLIAFHCDPLVNQTPDQRHVTGHEVVGVEADGAVAGPDARKSNSSAPKNASMPGIKVKGGMAFRAARRAPADRCPPAHTALISSRGAGELAAQCSRAVALEKRVVQLTCSKKPHHIINLIIALGL